MAPPAWFEELGVAPDATIEEVRRAYRRRARELHPDGLSADASDAERVAAAAAMSRLNAARAALEARVGDGGGTSPPRAERRRNLSAVPWLLLAAVMFAIFVFSAYAGPHGPARGQPGVTADTERSITASTNP